MLYKPDKIYIEEGAVTSRFTADILSRLSDVDSVILEKERIKEVSLSAASLREGKRILVLKCFEGAAFKRCPGFSEEVLCCNYYVIDLIENCPLDCVYCILQAFLNSPVITFHVNVEKIIKETTRAIKNNPGQPFRVGTGEHSDSLALDHIFQVNSYLIEAFSKLSNATLELKTKTDNVDLLLGLRHGGRTVVAWSLNPGEVIKRNEFKTASLEGRLIAAERVIKEGYRVAFHFDPIIYYPDWENGYRETIRLLFERIPPESIAWISLGTLRYIPALKQLVEDRFPGDAIFSNEFIPTKDGKMKYLKPIRRRLVGTLAEWISKKAPTVPLYLCMEKRSIWERVMSVQPEDHVALERYLSSTTLPNR